MARSIVLLVVVLFLCCCSVSWGQQEQQKQQGNETAPVVKMDNNMKLFASYRTTTEIMVSVITTVVPYLCYSTTGTATCMGKRRKRSMSPSVDVRPTLRSDTLDSSLMESLDGEAVTEENDAANKFFFTIWRTSTSIFTFISTSTNVSITVSAQALCTFAGFTGPVC